MWVKFKPWEGVKDVKHFKDDIFIVNLSFRYLKKSSIYWVETKIYASVVCNLTFGFTIIQTLLELLKNSELYINYIN